MSVDFGLLTDLDQIEKLFDKLRLLEDGFGFDIETGYSGPPREKFSIHPETAFVVGVSFSGHPSWARYTPLRHDSGGNIEDSVGFIRALARLLGSGKGIGHNISFELKHLAKLFRETLTQDELKDFGLKTDGYFPLFSDSMTEAYNLGKFREHGLKPITFEVTGHRMTEFSDLFPDATDKQKKAQRFNVLELTPRVVSYACEDAAYSLLLSRTHYPLVKDKLMYKVDMRIIPVVSRMEDRGLAFDWASMARWDQRAQAFNEALRAEIMADLSELCGEPIDINLGSPQQVGAVLYQKLGLVTTKLTDKGTMSTDAKALSGLAKKHPIVQKILDYRELKKLSGSYLTKYPRDFNYADDGRAHPSHNLCFVISGRFSVTDPAYQQCVDGDTEVLTPSGWVKICNLIPGMEVAQYHPHSDELEFVVPSEIIDQPYSGDMVEFSSERGTYRFTPDHRVGAYSRLRRSGGERWVEETAADWEARSLRGSDIDLTVPRAGIRVGGVSLSEDEQWCLRLAVMCQAEGHLRHDLVFAGRDAYEISVTKQRKIDQLQAFVARFGLRAQQSGSRFRCYVPRLLVDTWLDDSQEKNFKAEPILALSFEDLRAFIDETFIWDGDFTRRASINQSNKRRLSIEIIQAAAALCGYSTHTREYLAEDAIILNLNDRIRRVFPRADALSVSRVPSSGRVYCVRVPSSYFLMRRGGSVIVTGNCPKKYYYKLNDGTEFKLNFRDFIMAGPGHYLIGFDYSQVELRVLAGFCKEPALVKAFSENVDVHRATAASMFGVSIDTVSDEQRSVGKTINFATVYGQGPKGMAEKMGISIEEAKAFLEKYFATYSSLKSYLDRQTREGVARGKTVSKFGRVHPIWALDSDKPAIRANGERLCVNAPIQGSAADIMRIAMVRCMAAIDKSEYADRIHCVMNIHDALVFEVATDVHPQTVIDIVQPQVVFPVEGWPPIRADWEAGVRWGSMAKLELDDNNKIVLPEAELASVG